MNVFVLNSGRCGSSTFIQACRYIDNFSAGHESRSRCLGHERLAYPPRHIEADNRLCWHLGRLNAAFGDSAWFVHLMRAPAATAQSFARRRDFGIMQAWREAILMGGPEGADDLALAEDYLDNIEANIRHFLKDKHRQMLFRLEQAEADFERFWHWIGAEGDLGAAKAQWSIHYNAST